MCYIIGDERVVGVGGREKDTSIRVICDISIQPDQNLR